MMPPTENPITATSPVQTAMVHWAYLVGGSPDVFRDMRRHLMKAGINVCGHARMESRRDLRIPRMATVVLAATDGSNHSSTDAARDEARKRGIPCVLTPFRHWSVCHLRLTEAGILGNESIFKSGQREVTVRKFTALLESTPAVAAAAFRREVQKPSSEMTAAIREEIVQDQPEIAKALGIKEPPPPPPPPPKPAEARPAAPAIPRQDIVPTFRGKDLAERRRPDRTAEKHKARRDFARQLIKDAAGQITNIAVRAAVEKKFGTSITHPVLNHLRIELGYRPHKNGGHESDVLSASSLRARDSKAPPPLVKAAPPPAPPEVEAKPEAKIEAKPSPLVPVVAVPAGPVKGRRRTGKRDALTLIGELQEELRARGIWGVMIEAAGTFTFQKEK